MTEEMDGEIERMVDGWMKMGNFFHLFDNLKRAVLLDNILDST